MLSKTKHFARNLFRRQRGLSAGDVQPARDYIADYWEKLTRFHPKNDESLIGLPNPYLVPAHEEGHEFDFNELYYWDSYFMVQGLLDKTHQDLVQGILDDLFVEFDVCGVIPNASRTYLSGHSQPPFLTSFIWDVYDEYHPGKRWLKSAMKVAEAEYNKVWMGTTKPHARLVHKGLSRYYDLNYLHDLAEAESGWDMTPRFGRKCLNYLPVDLNALLYKYEIDLARYYHFLGDEQTADKWATLAHERKKIMNDLMWSSLKGFYYDYDYVRQKRSVVSSLAGFYPLWAGMVSEKQAAQMVKALRRFEQTGGLATTDVPQLGQLVRAGTPTQWAYPNGWAPLHFLVVQGLERYGYKDDARRIALKWLRTNLDWFNKNGIFLEKYNVVSPEKPPAKGLYPSQTGFGWTNSVFEYFCRKFIDVQ